MFRPAEDESETAADPAESDGCSLPSALPSSAARAVDAAELHRGRSLLITFRAPTSGAYGRAFWLAYISLMLLMVAVSLMYRYADFITFLGGGELELGAVVGVGMIGSLAMRLAQGVGIDRYGPRQIWLGSTALFVVSMLGHLLVSRPNGIEIFVLQALYRTSVAGVFGAVFTFVIQQVPVSRMAEAVGMIGTASFVGMLIGPLIGDVISSGGAGGLATRTELDLLFLVAAGLGSASVVAAWFATSREVRPPPRRHVPIAPLLRRYRPGVLLAIGVVTGIALGMPATFLRTFAAELSINRLAPYFTVYAVTAIAARLATRRLTERLGIRGAILIGMSLLVVGVVSYLAVATESQLLLPALFTGAGQAILYPAVVAGGSAAFPARYRGVGTTLMLATIDLGTLSGAPLIGGIVHFGRMIGLPGYPMMFVCIAALLIVSTVFYAGTGRSADAGRAESEKSPNPAVVLKGAPVEATSSA